MKKGMARRVKLVVLEYILAGTMHKTLVSPSTIKKITAVNPIAKAIGSPIIISNINTPKMAAVIMAFPSQTSFNYLIDCRKLF
jgi:glycine/serine hydroxymethyltransferase